MRVVHVINRYWPAPGGAERLLQEYAERQAAEGWDVTVLTTDAFDLEYFWDKRKRRVDRESERHNGVRIERFPIVHLPPNGLSFRVLRRLLGELDRLPGTTPLLRRMSRMAPLVPGLAFALRETPGRFDVVHGMNIALESLLYPALRHARAAGAPFLVSPLIHLGEGPRSLVRRYYTMKHQMALLREADLVLVQTPTEARYVIGRGVGEDRVITGCAGIRSDEAAGGDARAFQARHGIEGPIVLSVAAMAYDKGTFHLVEAMERLWARGVDAELVLAGAPMDQFDRFMAGRPESTRRRVRVLGRITEEEKRDLMAAGTVFAMPSRTESFGIVYLEAWLNGMPVVAANAGGVPDVVEHERAGLVTPFGDVNALAGAIERLLGDSELSKRLATYGAARVRQRHEWERVWSRVRPAFTRVGHERLPLARQAARG